MASEGGGVGYGGGVNFEDDFVEIEMVMMVAIKIREGDDEIEE